MRRDAHGALESSFGAAFREHLELKTVTVGYETVTWYTFFAPQT